jgi:hypothetical protein
MLKFDERYQVYVKNWRVQPTSCKGRGWFDDMGFVWQGQPAFDLIQCPGCDDCYAVAVYEVMES